MYETYTRYILTAWFSGRRNASLSLSPSLFRPLSFSCIFHAPRSLSAPTIFAARWREKTCLLLLLLLYEILHRLASSYAPPRRNGYIFFQRKFLLSKLYFNSSFYDSLRMKHHMCSISRLSWGKTRGIAIWRNYSALWHALSLSLTIIFIHIPRIFSFREERERIKNNWNNKIISIRAHTRFVKVQRL